MPGPARLRLCVALATMTAISAAQAQSGPRSCMVSDPTGTPLNIRGAPDGEVLGTLRNGRFVTMIGSARDARGRVWAQVVPEGFRTDVWVFREFISCR